MIVVVNSDVLFTYQFLHKRVHQRWRQFADGCRSVSAEIVIPGTALYEIELRQQELYENELDALIQAKVLLTKYGVDLETVSPKDLIAIPDVVQLFRDTGVSVRVEQATLQDFQDAERRASKHLAPAPPRTKARGQEEIDDSDEMRDLIIWVVACRLAASNDGAILLSRDKVHSGKRGRPEADSIGLRQAIDFDEALGILGAETPSGKIAIQFLGEAWNQLLGAGLPLEQQLNVKTIADAVFIQGDADIAGASFSFGCDSDKGKRFYGKALVSDIHADHFHLQIADARIDRSSLAKCNVNLIVTRRAPATTNDLAERYADLRNTLG